MNQALAESDHLVHPSRKATYGVAKSLLGAGAIVMALTTTGCNSYNISEELTKLSGSGWAIDDSRISVSNPTVLRDSSASDAQTRKTETPAEILRDIHSVTGLTWDQLARIFGVSRRSVHAWAAGGRMASSNEETLLRLGTMLNGQSPDLTADELRTRLLRTLQAEREAGSSTDLDINRSAATWNQA